ncbi:hypothetical protein ACFLVP_02280 [Chloroflexota bacterium]
MEASGRGSFEMSLRLFKKVVRWTLLVAILLYVITGYGITEFRTVERATFGLLTKPLSFDIHHYLIYPTAALLLLHVAIPIAVRFVRRNRSQAAVPKKRIVKLVK